MSIAFWKKDKKQILAEGVKFVFRAETFEGAKVFFTQGKGVALFLLVAERVIKFHVRQPADGIADLPLGEEHFLDAKVKFILLFSLNFRLHLRLEKTPCFAFVKTLLPCFFLFLGKIRLTFLPKTALYPALC